MFRFTLSLLAAMALAALSGAQDAAGDVPKDGLAKDGKDQAKAPLVLLPEVGRTPPVSPAVPVKLDGSQLYIVRSSVACLIVASPEGIVKVSADGGPLRVKARFTDGDGSYQLKEFTEKFVWCIEAVATGTCELIIIPAGGTEKDIVRRTIEANVGPRPPPPGPGPGPDDPLAQALSAALAKESDKSKLPALAALYRQFVNLAATSPAPTLGQFHDVTKVARINLIGEALPQVRAVITAELDSVLPTVVAAPLDAKTRSAMSAAFAHIATILEGMQ